MNFGQPDSYKKAAEQACRRYHLEDSMDVSLLYLSENATFVLRRLSDRRPCKVMRVARTGYRTLEEIQAEIRWLEHLSCQDKVKTAGLVKNRSNGFLTVAETGGQAYGCLMFEYLEGAHPDLCDGRKACEDFYQVGRIAALLHTDTEEWKESQSLDRPCWDYSHMIGEQGLFGDWRKCGELSAEDRQTLEQACRRIRGRLSRYERSGKNYGLIHSDLRAANLLKDKGRIQVIDFDDCGFGWHMYDLAASISFVEDHPWAGRWVEAWLRGYQTLRPLRREDLEEIPTFIMARRIQLLAWITSHEDSDPVRNMYPKFAKNTAELARRYLSGHHPAGG